MDGKDVFVYFSTKATSVKQHANSFPPFGLAPFLLSVTDLAEDLVLAEMLSGGVGAFFSDKKIPAFTFLFLQLFKLRHTPYYDLAQYSVLFATLT